MVGAKFECDLKRKKRRTYVAVQKTETGKAREGHHFKFLQAMLLQ